MKYKKGSQNKMRKRNDEESKKNIMDNNKHGMRWIFISLLVQISLSRIGRTGYLVFLGSDVVNFVVLTTKKYYRMQCNQSMIINHQGKRHVPWVKVSFIGIIVE
jgi:hypothetical protein